MTYAGSTHPSFVLRLRDREDQLSWSEFHERYGHMLYRYGRARGASHSDAEDVVQEVEMQLFQAIGGFVYDGRKGRFRSYLRAAVIHAISRKAHKKSHQPFGLDPHTFDYFTGEREAAQDEHWLREWRLHRMRQAIKDISSEFDATTLKAFEMIVLAGMAPADAAKFLEVSLWTVYRSRKRVLARLKAKLGESGADEGM